MLHLTSVPPFRHIVLSLVASCVGTVLVSNFIHLVSFLTGGEGDWGRRVLNAKKRPMVSESVLFTVFRSHPFTPFVNLSLKTRNPVLSLQICYLDSCISIPTRFRLILCMYESHLFVHTTNINLSSLPSGCPSSN